jgi:hypothetical protein
MINRCPKSDPEGFRSYREKLTGLTNIRKNIDE